MASVNRGSASYEQLIDFHISRFPERDWERIQAEVRDYLRRFAGLVPDCRPVEDGGLEGVTGRQCHEAYKQAMDKNVDITTLNRS